MSKFYFVGSGIASLAGAAYLIRDGHIAGRDIVIYEESELLGGALDAHGGPKTGYFMSGSRMFEDEYRCTFDLFSSIPSASNPAISVTEETNRAKVEHTWKNASRLVGRGAKIADAHVMGFDERDRIALLGLTIEPESQLDGKRISDRFDPSFFETNFWFEWSTLFAFQPWHSAIEFKRYLRRFLHHFATIDTQAGVYRTQFNQYDSLAVPLANWLERHGVSIRFGIRIDDLVVHQEDGKRVVSSIESTTHRGRVSIPLADDDFVLVTIGSMTADKAFGTNVRPPVLDRGKTSGAWQLWEKLARRRPELGKPATFDGHIDESIWESFTVTMTDPTFLRRIQTFSGSAPGTGGLMTFKDSSWLLTLSIFHNPYFLKQPREAAVWWGYGLHYDAVGDFVKKPMSACCGREILEEVLGHLAFDADRKRILDSSVVIPCVMPYITSQFLVRSRGDRPAVLPDGWLNLAFLGQFVEMPDDVVFTVEYSIRSAQTAVDALLGLDRKPLPIYEPVHDPKIVMEALETMHR